MRDHGDGLVEGLLRARLGSEPVIKMALGLLLDDDLRELSGIGRRIVEGEGEWWVRTIAYSGWNR